MTVCLPTPQNLVGRTSCPYQTHRLSCSSQDTLWPADCLNCDDAMHLHLNRHVCMHAARHVLHCSSERCLVPNQCSYTSRRANWTIWGQGLWHSTADTTICYWPLRWRQVQLQPSMPVMTAYLLLKAWSQGWMYKLNRTWFSALFVHNV